MSQRNKSKAGKAEKASFLLAWTSTVKAKEGLSLFQNGTGPPSDKCSRSPPVSPVPSQGEGPLTATTMRAMMAEFATTIQSSIKAQIQSLATELRKEFLDVGRCIEHMERKMDDFARVRNSVADKLKELEDIIQAQKFKLADIEDCSRTVSGEQIMLIENQTDICEVWIVGLRKLHESRTLFFHFFLFIYMVIITGNLLVVSLVLRSYLHSPMYFFLSNLSSCEIMFTLNIVPQFLQVLLSDGSKISLMGCLTQFYVCGSLAATECFLLTAMSYDRYVAICNPLHYNYLMDLNVCHQIAATCWAGGFLSMLTTLVLVSRLTFCDPCIIDHFFCDFAPILDISCSDTYLVKIETFIFTSSVSLFTFLFIIATYVAIMITIFRIPFSSGRKKSFSTCSSHLAIVSTYYGTLITVYVVPSGGNSNTTNRSLSLMYTLVTPLFNPIIYSLRNQDIKLAILKLVKSKS
ncbi:olfactory receptor 6N1-like [Pelobates fuscus]|uniref:olfactory receptor 6N1-like n=1 Tax=Pelobates fuscus TaxID=191477 RepID=UPI002FE4ED74